MQLAQKCMMRSSRAWAPIVNRTHEHLGTTDLIIIQVRRRLIDAAKTLRDHGTTPPGVDDPEVYGVRTATVIVPKRGALA